MKDAQAAIATPELPPEISLTGCTSRLITSWQVDGTPHSVREALSDIMLSVAACGTREDLCQNLEMVVAEVLNNVVEHAYSGRTDGWIEIRVDCQPSSLDVCIRDGGIAMPGGALPSGAVQDLTGDVADLPEGGFGWFLIRSLTEALSYVRNGDVNQTSFRMSLEQQ